MMTSPAPVKSTSLSTLHMAIRLSFGSKGRGRCHGHRAAFNPHPFPALASYGQLPPQRDVKALSKLNVVAWVATPWYTSATVPM